MATISSEKSSAKAKQGRGKGTYSFVSLGCPKNLVDSERMLGLLQLDGYQLVSEPAGADFVVVNTCGFIERARDESYATIQEMLELKRKGDIRGVIVSGCLAEREKEKLLETLPEIDHLVGVFGREQVTKVADRLIAGLDEQRTVFNPAPSRPLDDRGRLRITPRHFAFLKISEGCDRLCTFCAIPKMRGKHATKPMEEVIAEAEELAADGVRELVIVAQDTTYYGLDLYGETRLVELLRRLEQVEGIEWIRLMYLYPMYFGDDLIDTIAASKKIIPYLDLPLQHINDTMLKRMQRRVNRAATEDLLAKLRARINGLVMRTTFITGFPGETEEQFEELVDFARTQRFERLGVFTYSFEPDTPAAKLPDHLPDQVKEARRERLMDVQQKIAFAWNEAQHGRRLDVLIDRAVPAEKNAWIGRSFADAPDVDGVVYVSGQKLRPGKLVECEIVATSEYDLVGVAVGKPRYEDPRVSVATKKQLGGQRVFNVPNQLTALRLLLSLVLFVLIAFEYYLASMFVFAVAAGTDWLDGYWARKYGQVTNLGRILDPFVDKIIICGTFIFLAAVAESGVKAWMAVLVVGRELLVTALRSYLEGEGADFSASMSGKLKMVAQCLAAILSLWALYYGSPRPEVLAWAVTVAVYAAIIMTIYSGAAYVRRAVLLLST